MRALILMLIAASLSAAVSVGFSHNGGGLSVGGTISIPSPYDRYRYHTPVYHSQPRVVYSQPVVHQVIYAPPPPPVRQETPKRIYTANYPSGRTAVIGYLVDGVRHGTWTWFDENGHFLRQIGYEHGHITYDTSK